MDFAIIFPNLKPKETCFSFPAVAFISYFNCIDCARRTCLAGYFYRYLLTAGGSVTIQTQQQHRQHRQHHRTKHCPSIYSASAD